MRRKIGVVLWFVLLLCTVAGCGKEPKYETWEITSVPVTNVIPKTTVTPKTDDEILTIAPSETTELPIYTINSDLTDLSAVTALVVDEKVITEEVVTDAVVAGLADCAIYVVVNEVIRDNDRITVDFSADAPPVTQVGAGIEGLILDAFGQSLLDNVFGCNSVSFSVDGGDYCSGHIEFSKDEIYMRR